ncbi:MAG: dTMP kinase, partial [Planctomycetota bacterium]
RMAGNGRPARQATADGHIGRVHEAFDYSRLRGKFLVLDGGEGCGKSTQIGRLHDRLVGAGLPVLRLRDPGSTDVGEKLRDVLLDPATGEISMRCEMLVYMASRAELVAKRIRPALDEGQVVLLDRFVSSTLAYQAGFGELTPADVKQVAAVATGGLEPDLTIILDVPTEIALQRTTPQFVPLFDDPAVVDPTRDRIEQRPETYHKIVRQHYLDQAGSRTKIVDAAADADAVENDIHALLAERFA